MNENPFSTPQPATAGDTPSVSSAAADLRNAAGEFKETAGAQATKIKEKAVETANALKASATEKAEHYKTVASEKAEHYKAVATEKAEHYKTVATEKSQQAKENAQKQWDDTRVKAKEIHVTAEDYIRQNPTKAVLGALGVGFLIGLIARN
ncbi:MAG: hypothetical protein NWT08_09650 [Akkermansiaceae bacterium]|jgi:ElaB/YqjD/DUF883 family membrane-anchored ribosome-binding protein|nr:hypothetical protein [Akkermansiaceae bacterium]MDP4647306.1 hypothetical protein [Akkermansiaceae bacterium]MDP4721898.1 hypothetical protein [Akkermansiaceae bacterium]MDP4780959.1 hypothetical protein [Akkermansiaceae bacterium]MDP4898053.1 hypothetical protein [Akkermansiaceae bacterium]